MKPSGKWYGEPLPVELHVPPREPPFDGMLSSDARITADASMERGEIDAFGCS